MLCGLVRRLALSTFGRGLSLVALHSAAWGSDLDPDGHGKTVWFEPVDEPREDIDIEGDLFDIDEAMAHRHFAEEPEETIEIRLLGMPVAGFRDLRRHYHELRRELRLLALTDPDRYPFAAELSDVAMQVEQERRQSQGVERLAQAARPPGCSAAPVPTCIATSEKRLRGEAVLGRGR